MDAKLEVTGPAGKLVCRDTGEKMRRFGADIAPALPQANG
jgi:hypothetical protein